MESASEWHPILDTVYQDELAVLQGLKGQIEHLQRLYNKAAATVTEELRAGAKVEPGKLKAELANGGTLRVLSFSVATFCAVAAILCGY